MADHTAPYFGGQVKRWRDMGDGTYAEQVAAAPSADQDPIFDHANGTKNSVTASQTIITPPAGCKYVRVSSNVDCFVRTDGQAAADAAGSILVSAGAAEIIPVVAGTAVTAFAASTAVVRCMPYKVR